MSTLTNKTYLRRPRPPVRSFRSVGRANGASGRWCAVRVGGSGLLEDRVHIVRMASPRRSVTSYDNSVESLIFEKTR